MFYELMHDLLTKEKKTKTLTKLANTNKLMFEGIVLHTGKIISYINTK